MADPLGAYIAALQRPDFSAQCLRLLEEEKRYSREGLEELRALIPDIIDPIISIFLRQRPDLCAPVPRHEAAPLFQAAAAKITGRCRENGFSLETLLSAFAYIRHHSLHLYLGFCSRHKCFVAGLLMHDLLFDQLAADCATAWLHSEMAVKQRRLREANHFILQEKRRYRSIFDRMSEPALIVDQHQRIVDVNKAFERFFGTDRKSLAGKNCSLVLGSVTCKDSQLKQAMASSSSFADLETELRVKGTRRNVLVAWAFLGEINGELSGGIVIIQDITERKSFERELRESEEKYRSLVENVPDVTWRADEKGNISFVSPNVKQITGFETEEVKRGGRQGWLEHIAEEDRDQVVNAFASIFVRNAPSDVCYRFRRKDGVWVWLRDRTGKFYKQAGVRHVDGVLSDITNLKLVEYELEQHHLRLAEMVDRRTEELRLANEKLRREIEDRQEAEDELLQLAQRLQESNAELEQFAQVASHDMKEPLVLISAFAERLEKKYFDRLDEKGREYVRRIIVSANKLRELINALLELARVTTKQGRFQRIDLELLLREVVDQLEEQLRECDGEISIISQHCLEGDRMQVWQLFQNILGNAIKYRRSGVRPRVVVTSRTMDDQWCEISVEDNGIGFSQEEAEKIFIPFERLHPESRYEGTGMGLATCRKIVARHGGEIIARGVPGQGATFIIRLPLCRIDDENEQ